MTLEDTAEQILKDETAQDVAVKSLIKVDQSEKGKDPDVELKTDLDDNEIRSHSVLQTLTNCLEMNSKEFGEKCVLRLLLNTKERKAISRNRQSRQEIVAIARNPDQNTIQGDVNESFAKKFLTPRK